ncbi:MAG TPA: hypothetical protein VFN74_00510 [Chloroflexota bacterium]|nr:hypothetical protein [Chloroflexota bacterium]
MDVTGKWIYNNADQFQPTYIGPPKAIWFKPAVSGMWGSGVAILYTPYSIYGNCSYDWTFTWDAAQPTTVPVTLEHGWYADGRTCVCPKPNPLQMTLPATLVDNILTLTWGTAQNPWPISYYKVADPDPDPGWWERNDPSQDKDWKQSW